MKYYAHSVDGRPPTEWQSLREHLRTTADLAASFLNPFARGELGHACGLLHDVGKYSPEFYARLRGGPRVDHATKGAQLAIEAYRQTQKDKIVAKVITFAVAGHHGGLLDGTDLQMRLTKSVADLDPVWQEEITVPERIDLDWPTSRKMCRDWAAFALHMLIRMAYSALVDADHIDTGNFYAAAHGSLQRRMRPISMGELAGRLRVFMDAKTAAASSSTVNSERKKVLDSAIKLAVEKPGIYTLTVPTGGGKTLASLSFALEHAATNDMPRAIFVIPYISIIEQTADVFRDALSDNHEDNPIILEHHSSFDSAAAFLSREGQEKLRLATENWDAPVVVTTAVQFFESLYANKPGRCRKLHNIAGSVIVLDEAQMMPLSFLRPCVAMLDELVRNWGCSIVLCTATQPAVLEKDGFQNGLENAQEIAPTPSVAAKTLRRVKFGDIGRIEANDLASRIKSEHQVMCITGTRKRARDLYELVRNASGARHLSTWMCAMHRREVLHDIKAMLARNDSVRLISTSLVECGVDVDFLCVYREAAGLESIIQAGGRCNREGKLPRPGDVTIYSPAGEYRIPEIARRWSVAKEAWRQANRVGRDLLDLATIRDYYQRLYWMADAELDSCGILDSIASRRTDWNFPFASIADKMRIIDSDDALLIIPYFGPTGTDRTVDRVIRNLDIGVTHDIRGIARTAQQYSVGVAPSLRHELITSGSARVIRKDVYGEQFVLLTNSSMYALDTGFSL